ncbi:ATP-binding cassette domain-containing protein, partial [Candidatus Woesearchaeota archaeon]|nr:ATP-binding cassette domain-containing protein [Candidatus Woesearchaeota archaeon]
GISEKLLVERIKELLRFVGLENAPNVIASNLSGGMQKRLDIACALIHEPKILILDEPTADLDPLLRKQMWQLIQSINRKGTTVIVASHFVDEIEENCSRIAVLANKRIQKMGTAEQLAGEYARNYEILIETRKKDYSNLNKALSRLSVVDAVIEKNNNIVVYTPEPGRLLSWFAKYCQQKKEKINKLNLAKPSLSEVFESIVKNEV